MNFYLAKNFFDELHTFWTYIASKNLMNEYMPDKEGPIAKLKIAYGL